MKKTHSQERTVKRAQHEKLDFFFLFMFQRVTLLSSPGHRTYEQPLAGHLDAVMRQRSLKYTSMRIIMETNVHANAALISLAAARL